ncbi:Anaphase-promoting complex subunit 4 [Penicillium occitanis (nom. inval.)]|nr:Anaphase-promoting complex subunit 4 [Penicillium occitanis (nom. inval.)]PCH07964.1 hypothetical protein PENOC_016450 [Penicillium occitanis (nom. inval.)]
MTQPTTKDARNTLPSQEQEELEPPPKLVSVAEKTLPAKCKDGSFLTYCPTMDLVALATEDEQLYVYRLNGQEVLSADLAGDPYLDEVKGEIRGVRWKNDGRLLAVADAENKLRIISSYTGKTVHHFSSLPHDEDGHSSSPNESTKDPKDICITCIGWGVNFTDSKAAQHHLRDGRQISIEDLLAPDTDPVKAALQLKADLPRELALLDVESSLPRLSTLPGSGSGSDEDLFSTRASLDTIFQSFNRMTSDAVDVLFVGLNDGRAHLRIFDCFEIGNVSVTASKTPASTQVEILAHSSHPMSSTHAIVLSEKADGATDPVLKVMSLDLRFITKSGRYLSLLAFKITQLQNLLRYINQTQRQIALEWKNVYELPARFMRSIADELQEKCHCDFVTALYHLVVTGNCFPPVKDFLVDIIGERRCEVLLSRLIGISKFHKLNHILGLETRDLQEVVETLDCLHLLSHSILTKTTRELHQFMEFARWLRHEIDIQTAEPMSQTLEELLEKSDMIDHATTLEYIEGALTKSSLRRYISSTPGTGTAAGDAQKRVSDGEKLSFYQAFKNTLAAEEDEKSGDHNNSNNKNEPSRPALPQLNHLIARLESQCGKVFGKIALTQRRSILHHCLLVLHPDCDPGVVDTIMHYESLDNEDEYAVYVASRLKMLIYKIMIQCTNGVSSTKNVAVASFRLPGGEVKQAQFVEDGTIMLLYTEKDQSYLHELPLTPKTDHEDLFRLEYTIITDSQTLPTPSDLDTYILHMFPKTGTKAKPVRMNVNGRKERRAACILSADMMHYEVLDIDNHIEIEAED